MINSQMKQRVSFILGVLYMWFPHIPLSSAVTLSRPVPCPARGDISGAGGWRGRRRGNFLSTCILSTHYRCMCNGHCINRHDHCTRHSVRGTTMQKVSWVCCALVQCEVAIHSYSSQYRPRLSDLMSGL